MITRQLSPGVDDLTRRHFFGRGAGGLGVAALGALLTRDGFAANQTGQTPLTHFAPKAKRVIYLFQSGGPSQMDLFDHKPQMDARFDEDLPDSIRMGQRITTMTSGQSRFPVVPSMFKFARHGQSGASLSELLPHTAEVADDLCFVKSMVTEAINHDPAITFFQTGSQLSGRPSMGAWFSYGLGSENANLPDFIAMTSSGSGLKGAQPLYDRLWGSGFLPTTHQGVKLRGSQDPVLYLNNPPGVSRELKRAMLDNVAALNHKRLGVVGDPEIATRIAQYEMAFRMQASIPELVDFSDEPQSVIDLYGPEVHTRGSYASNCLLARRLSERGVRFVQLFHKGWDQHANLPNAIRAQCRDTDQPSAALIRDLKDRGLLDETLVVWGGEFGRTAYCQGNLSRDNYGRDHHPRCFTIWMAGGGIKGGISWGETDDFSYNITANPVAVHDLHATMLHLMGMDHRRLTYRFQGRDHRLTDVHGTVLHSLLA
ncbi:DUF1501 domain-containing protein [Pirellulales bacterium]|nr:DUF1501 domain-containing protein [Pirellulales bacterium]